MNGHSAVPLLCLGLALLAPACQVEKDTVATVGDRQLEVSALQAYLEAVTGEQWQAVEQRVASRLLDQLIDQEVVVAAAKDADALPPPLQADRRSAAVRQLLATACGPVPPLSPELLEQEVARRLTEPQPARAHVRQLLLSSAETAAAARQRVLDGEDFVTVSNDESMAANAAAGGELGMVIQGTLPEPMDEVIFALAAGELSAPVESPAGFHVFEVLEMHPAGPPARAQVEAAVNRKLSEDHAQRFVRDCVGRLATEVGVEVVSEHLWFHYDGKFTQSKRGDSSLHDSSLQLAPTRPNRVSQAEGEN